MVFRICNVDGPLQISKQSPQPKITLWARRSNIKLTLTLLQMFQMISFFYVIYYDIILVGHFECMCLNISNHFEWMAFWTECDTVSRSSYSFSFSLSLSNVQSKHTANVFHKSMMHTRKLINYNYGAPTLFFNSVRFGAVFIHRFGSRTWISWICLLLLCTVHIAS